MGRRTIEGWPARVSGWSIDAENICSRALLQLLRAAIGTGLKTSAAQQLRQRSGGARDIPGTSVALPPLTQSGHLPSRVPRCGSP